MYNQRALVDQLVSLIGLLDINCPADKEVADCSEKMLGLLGFDVNGERLGK